MYWIFFILFLPSVLFGQSNISTKNKSGRPEGIIYLKDDKVVKMPYQWMIDYYTYHLQDIESINGQETIVIPIEREYKKNIRSRKVDGYFVQYSWTPNLTDVSIPYVRCKVIEFDFKNKAKAKEKTLSMQSS